MGRLALIIIFVLSLAAPDVSAGDGLNPAGNPRYGAHALGPGFSPAPTALDALSGGDIAVKSLSLGDNCLGYAASDPDFLIELTADFSRITFLAASEADTTLIVHLPNGSWACNDDTNGLNPALVFHSAPAGGYRVWIGSYAADTNDESILYISEAGPETLPTTATGPDPEREPLYGETSLTPGSQPAPFTIQIVGGGRNQVADHIAGQQCHGFVAEAPDFSIYLSDAFAQVSFAVFSPADMTLLVNAADGSWHCNDERTGRNPGVDLRLPRAGLYDVWVGSADEGNYAAAILYVSANEPEASADYDIDTSCDGLPDSALHVGGSALVTAASPSGVSAFTSPDSATTRIYLAPPGSALSLVGGPICADGRRWWRADFGGRVFGWVAEGDASARWLAPPSR